jgi:hypothetical protein
MKIEEVTEDRDEVKVTTTGAVYIFQKTSLGEILCHQRLGQERLVSKLTLNTSLCDLTVDWKDDASCFLSALSKFGMMRVNADSLLTLSPWSLLKVTCQGDWVPEYSAVEKNNFIFIDEKGGTGVYPIQTSSVRLESPELGLNFSTEGWQAFISLQGEQRLLVSVFPPRPFDLKKSFNDRIVHHFFRTSTKPWGFYPKNREIEEYSRYGNILVLQIWQKGKLTRTGMGIQSRDEYARDAVWSNFHHEALDDIELKRVIEKAHQEEMKVLPYLSGVYYPGEPQEFVSETVSLMGKYGFDGALFDGISNHILRGYTIIRGLRKALGKKILYVHVPSPIIGDHKRYYVFCPFIDTYADYIVRAEHVANRGASPGLDSKYIRYTISGYNVSNSIGFFANYDYPPELTRTLIPQVLKAKARLSYWVQWDRYVKERQKAVGAEYFPLEETRKIMREEYFPALNALQTEKSLDSTANKKTATC